MSELRSCIVGTGSALPKRVVTNEELAQRVETSDQWITERTGIRQRHVAEEGEKLSDYAVGAARAALEAAELEASDIDLIVCATVTPDWHLPATACFIQRELGATGPAFDLSAGCSGFLYAEAVADSFIRTGAAKRVLVIGGELLSKFINWKDRSTCVIFADGAGAVILEGRKGERGILATRLQADGRMADVISIPGGGSEFPPSHEMIDRGQHFIHMKGNETFKLAIRALTSSCQEVLEGAGFGPKDVDLFVPHQANARIIKAVGDRLGIDAEHSYVNIDRVGNTSAASIPIALDEAVRAGRVATDDLLLFAAFGAGLTWGASLVRW